jgi:ferritin-like metal-binding protein YciE
MRAASAAREDPSDFGLLGCENFVKVRAVPPVRRRPFDPGAHTSERRFMQLQNLHDLFVEQLQDLYSAEQQLVEALPKMANASSHEELRDAFEHHLEETRGHVQRLEQIFSDIGESPNGEKCKGMEGLIKEGQEVLEMKGDPTVIDAALIAAAQRVEHYEIAGYGTVKTLADHLDLGDAKSLLDDTLDEESKADKLLTKIATGGAFKSGINQKAKA